MARVTTADIKKIFKTGETDLTVFADQAHLLVETVIAAGLLSEALLTEIERYLAAHFACVLEPRMESQSVHPATTRYEGQTGMGLARTRYGQQVMLLDTTGSFADVNAGTTTAATTSAEFMVFSVSEGTACSRS